MKIQQQEVVYFPEALPFLYECYLALQQEEEFLNELKIMLAEHVEIPVVLFLADCVQKKSGDEAAKKIITDYLPQQVSLPILQRLLAYQARVKNSESFETIVTALQQWIARFSEQNARYQCDHCGFKGKILHWMCPGCKRWGTSKPT